MKRQEDSSDGNVGGDGGGGDDGDNDDSKTQTAAGTEKIGAVWNFLGAKRQEITTSLKSKSHEIGSKYGEWKKQQQPREEEKESNNTKEEIKQREEQGEVCEEGGIQQTTGTKKFLNFLDSKRLELQSKHEEWKKQKNKTEEDATKQDSEEKESKSNNDEDEDKEGNGGGISTSQEENGSSRGSFTTTGQQQAKAKIFGFLQKTQSELQRNIETNKKKLIDSIGRQHEHYFGGPIIEFPDDESNNNNTKSVRIGKKLAQGGFSVVFHAVDVSSTTNNTKSNDDDDNDNNNDHQSQNNDDDNRTQYALKRIQCIDEETQRACEEEADIHHTLKDHENYILPLLGCTYDPKDNVCYMLFPYMPHSLKEEINQRLLVPMAAENQAFLAADDYDNNKPPPWKETLVLKIFYHLLHGVEVMHQAGYAHCDIKVDNILFYGNDEHSLKRPIIMDFGSVVTPTKRILDTRWDVAEAVELASQHTTMPYRPPELFPGEIQLLKKDSDNDDDDSNVLDYTLVDVWSLGCTLFAILFGASPFESEFSRTTGRHRVIECSQLNVLGDIPKPPNDKMWACYSYSDDIWRLLEWILQKDRRKRPTLNQVQTRVEALMVEATTREVELESGGGSSCGEGVDN